MLVLLRLCKCDTDALRPPVPPETPACVCLPAENSEESDDPVEDPDVGVRVTASAASPEHLEFTISYSQHYSRPKSLTNTPTGAQVLHLTCAGAAAWVWSLMNKRRGYLCLPKHSSLPSSSMDLLCRLARPVAAPAQGCHSEGHPSELDRVQLDACKAPQTALSAEQCCAGPCQGSSGGPSCRSCS